VKKLLFILAAAWLAIAWPAAFPAEAKTDLSALNRLDGVSTLSGEGEARVVIRFARKSEFETEPEFFEKSIQLDFKGAYVAPSKRSFTLKDPLVTGAAAYQLSGDTVRLRLFVSGDPRDYAKKWKTAHNGERLILTLARRTGPARAPNIVQAPHDAKAAPGAGTSGAKPADTARPETAGETRPSGADVTTLVRRRSAGTDEKISISPKWSAGLLAPGPAAAEPRPVTVQSAQKTASPPAAQKAGAGGADAATAGFLDYQKPEAPEAPAVGMMFVKMISSLALVLGMIFILAWAGKKYLGGLIPGGGFDAAVTVLATGSVGVKHQVSVVDVAGEALIIGISGDRMTLLGSIHDEESVERLRRGVARSSAPVRHGVGAKGQPRQATWTPEFVRKAMATLRIGRKKASPKIMRALYDQADPETFAGVLAGAGGMAHTSEEVAAIEKDKPSREDLMRRVTSAIRERNTRARIA